MSALFTLVMKIKLLRIKFLPAVALLGVALSGCATVRDWVFSPDELEEGTIVVIEADAEESDASAAAASSEATDSALEVAADPAADPSSLGSGQYNRDDALYDPLGYGDNYILRETGEIVLMPTVREVSIDTSQIERLLYRSAQHIEDSRRFFYANQYEEALYEVNAALELTPRSATAYSIKGSIEYKRGNVAQARASWSVALQLDPSLKNVEQMLALLDE